MTCRERDLDTGWIRKPWVCLCKKCEQMEQLPWTNKKEPPWIKNTVPIMRYNAPSWAIKAKSHIIYRTADCDLCWLLVIKQSTSSTIGMKNTYCNFTKKNLMFGSGSDRPRIVRFRLNFGVLRHCRNRSMYFFFIFRCLFLISVTTVTTEITENKTTPNICESTVFFVHPGPFFWARVTVEGVTHDWSLGCVIFSDFHMHKGIHVQPGAMKLVLDITDACNSGASSDHR